MCVHAWRPPAQAHRLPLDSEQWLLPFQQQGDEDAAIPLFVLLPPAPTAAASTERPEGRSWPGTLAQGLTHEQHEEWPPQSLWRLQLAAATTLEELEGLLRRQCTQQQRHSGHTLPHGFVR